MTTTSTPVHVDTGTAVVETNKGGDDRTTLTSSGGPCSDAAVTEQGGRRGESKFGERPECFSSTLQEVSFVFQATVATATTSFLTGVAMIVTSNIGRDLGMTQGEISWVTAATSLVAGSTQLGLGQLADLIGRKPMFLIGMASFSASVLLLAFAQNPFWMIIMCGVVGLPSAMIVPPAIGILGAAYREPSRRKNAAFSAFSAGNPLGFVFGLIVCGVASSIASWRAAYVFLAVLWALFTVHALWAVPAVESFGSAAARAPLRERLGALKQFDAVGTVLTIFGCGMFTAGLTLGPAAGWKSALVIVLLVVGLALLVVFAFWERVFPTPLIPPHVWKDRDFSLIIIVVVLGTMGFTASTFWVAYFMQEVQKLPTLMVAVRLLPMAVAGLIWNVLAATLLHRINNTLIMGFGSICFLTSSLLFAFMKENSNYWAFIFPALVLNVAGIDLQFNVANMYVMQALPVHQQALAGGIFSVTTRLSISIVMGLSTAVFTSVQLSPAGAADPTLPYTRTFQAAVALSAAGVLFVPFIRLGTQGNAEEQVPEAIAIEANLPQGADPREKLEETGSKKPGEESKEAGFSVASSTG